jgi:hypothetical protein
MLARVPSVKRYVVRLSAEERQEGNHSASDGTIPKFQLPRWIHSVFSIIGPVHSVTSSDRLSHG